ncbi:RNA-binding (RRM/RBD/RNP motifs) family protein [Euphorbia peplus]|nr:RNA-binding (RRM/RBD/RNP motifs) family protein [Euphorbia peplus]
MATLTSLNSSLSSSTSTKPSLVPQIPSKPTFLFLIPNPTFSNFPTLTLSHRLPRPPTKLFAVAEEAAAPAAPPVDPSSEAARRLYVGNIPRTTDNDQLQQIVQEHGAVEKVEVMYDKYTARSRRFAFVTMKTVEDAEAVIEKLNGTEVGGREIKVNITEKPLTSSDKPVVQNLFSEKGQVLSAKVSRVPGTSKSSGYGFVSFSSEEDVEAAVSAFNDSLLEGQKLRVNKA